MEINVILQKNESLEDCLVFELSDDKKFAIKLNSDDQVQLRQLFFELIQLLVYDEVVLRLNIEENYDVNIFRELAAEYVDALNDELKSIANSVPTK